MSTGITRLTSESPLRRLARWRGAAMLPLIVMIFACAEPPTVEAPELSDTVDNVMELAAREQHEAAVAMFERVKENQPETIESIHGHKVAVIYAHIGDPARHAAHCLWLIERYRDAELPTDAERSVKGYVLAPSTDDPALLEHALERTRLATDYAEERGEGEYQLWFEGSRGMAAYRVGNYDEAVTHLEKAAEADNLYISSLALPFLAMAEFARGNHERAGTVMEQARAEAARLPEPGSDEYLREWTDTLTTQLAMREAEEVIAGG